MIGNFIVILGDRACLKQGLPFELHGPAHKQYATFAAKPFLVQLCLGRVSQTNDLLT